ncbi:MAG: DoxX family protein [Acidimicrobiia bacterium]
MELFLFFLEGALALFFFASGASKLFWSREALSSILPHAMDFSNSGFRALGGVELAASMGLLLPIFIGSVELLAPLAATALVVLQTWKGTLHWRRTRNGAYATLTLLIVLGLLVILWGRLGQYPL